MCGGCKRLNAHSNVFLSLQSTSTNVSFAASLSQSLSRSCFLLKNAAQSAAAAASLGFLKREKFLEARANKALIVLIEMTSSGLYRKATLFQVDLVPLEWATMTGKSN